VSFSTGYEGVSVKSIFHIVIWLSIMGVAAQVSAAPESNSNQVSSDRNEQLEVSYKAPYSFTADELWGKILKVAERPDGYVTKEQVENIFGVTMKLDEEYLKQYHEKIYPLIREKSWYFNMSIGENNPTRSFFYFNWGVTPGQRAVELSPPPQGMCIDVRKIGPALAQRGWSLKREIKGANGLPDSNSYRKIKWGLLTVEFYPADYCLRSIRITASITVNQDLMY
jgi:hypothetical protein